MAISPVWPISSVWPSGGADTTAWVPIAPVLDDDVLAKRFGERHRDEARHDVAGAARRIGDDDVDGAVWEVLRGGRNGGDDQRRRDEAKPNEHFLISSGGDCRGRGWRCPGEA
jgi:hypothetical protein